MREHTKPTACFGRRGERFLRLALILSCLPLLVHCGGDDATGGIVPEQKDPVFTASGTPSAPNRVTIAYGSTATGSLITLDVKVGGPTDATDLFSFAFDIVLSNPAIIRSVTAEAGDALTGQQTVDAKINGDRIVVGVTKLGGAGNGIGASGATIMKLTIRTDTNTPGSTTLTFVDADSLAQDHTGAEIGSIEFDSAPAKLEQPQ